MLPTWPMCANMLTPFQSQEALQKLCIIFAQPSNARSRLVQGVMFASWPFIGVRLAWHLMKWKNANVFLAPDAEGMNEEGLCTTRPAINTEQSTTKTETCAAPKPIRLKFTSLHELLRRGGTFGDVWICVFFLKSGDRVRVNWLPANRLHCVLVA